MPDAGENLIRGPHEQNVTVTLKGSPDLVLDVLSGEVAFDESWSPHVEGRLTIPYDEAVLARLDPRQPPPRITVDVQVVAAAGTATYAVCNLGLRAVSVDYEAGTISVELASDEALVVDSGAPGHYYMVYTTDQVPTVISGGLWRALGYTPTLLNQLPTGTYSNGLTETYSLFDEWWPFLKDMADRIGAQLYDRGDRTWVLRLWPETLAATPDHVIRAGADGTVVFAQTDISREPWYNVVRVMHEWHATREDGSLSASMSRAFGRAWVTSPSASYDSANNRVTSGAKLLPVKRDWASNADACRVAAEAILRRRLRAGVTVTADAVAAWWLRPGMTVGLDVPDAAAPSSGLVARVRFNLATGLMSVALRDPLDVAISTG